MVQPEHEELSVRQQCALLHLARSNLYYQPMEADAEDLALMRQIDKLYLEHPYYGSRRMQVVLRQQGLVINRKRVQRLMRLMGLEGMAPGPRTSRPHPEHPRFPYLLRQLAIVRPDQVWASDITYVPLERGWAYLVVIMDWFSRAVLAWRLSNTLSVEFCLEALEEALGQWGPPEIFNTDQGAQYTAIEWVAVLLAHEVRVSMDGKGRWMDNVFMVALKGRTSLAVISTSTASSVCLCPCPLKGSLVRLASSAASGSPGGKGRVAHAPQGVDPILSVGQSPENLVGSAT